jgi:ABC-type spermidine/putrescine transport system permease subunit I
MIHKFFDSINVPLVASILGALLLYPFAYFIQDSKKNPEKYKEH